MILTKDIPRFEIELMTESILHLLKCVDYHYYNSISFARRSIINVAHSIVKIALSKAFVLLVEVPPSIVSMFP